MINLGVILAVWFVIVIIGLTYIYMVSIINLVEGFNNSHLYLMGCWKSIYNYAIRKMNVSIHTVTTRYNDIHTAFSYDKNEILEAFKTNWLSIGTLCLYLGCKTILGIVDMI